MNNNERLKAILFDVKLLYKNKMLQMQEVFGEDNVHLSSASKKTDEVFGLFENPTVWTKPIPFEEDTLLLLILGIDKSKSTDLGEFINSVGKLNHHLEHELLVAPMSINGLNTRLLESLLKIKSSIIGRKQFFRNKGEDLNLKPEFLALETELQPLWLAFTQALESDTILAVENDVLIFERLLNAIKLVTDVAEFLRLFKLLIVFIKRRLPNQLSPLPS